MPRADARLLAIEEDISRGGMRRGTYIPDALGLDRRGEDERATSLLVSRSSETAGDGLTVFSEAVTTSVSVTDISAGSFRSSESFWWCCSKSLSVLKASSLHVPTAAFANSPAAKACSLIATVVSDVWVAFEAARAWSCAYEPSETKWYHDTTAATYQGQR